MSDAPTPPTYDGMPPGEQIPAPQLVRDARALVVGYEADPDALESVLPPGLEPHPNNRIQMNMYRVETATQTSHLPPYSLTYLCVEVAGHDSTALSESGGEMDIPGRYWVGYWNDSPRMQSFVRETMGIPCMPGVCRWERDGDELTSTLSVDGDPVITATASVDDEQIDTLSGHLNYYSRRQIPDPSGAGAQIDELVEIPIPFTCDLATAQVSEVEFAFPDGSSFQRFAPVEPISTPSVLYGDITITYSQGRQVRDYRAARAE
ncbi:acetoacetate decarboxylase [Halovenus sp. WSH3]|uniref:Acetoacetate decarboxylase n=1 Tax=Halovenus carboxidivorans TaxID=2692199 RepID=A0A6B0T521_9EURY|nr:acetoacetate decarboxylase family protein [Halovenus carboxidivorans]MXR51276.1 acetoacetate decarboxylase [Halovenus carboxidivorans]